MQGHCAAQQRNGAELSSNGLVWICKLRQRKAKGRSAKVKRGADLLGTAVVKNGAVKLRLSGAESGHGKA